MKRKAAPSLRSGGHVVVTIAAALYSTTLVTSVLGFAFWLVAARLTTPEVVGRSAAVISAMQFIAAFATLGLHTLLIAELSGRDGHDVRRLVLTSLGIAGAVSFAAAGGYAVVHYLVGGTEQMYGTATGVAVFGIGTAVTTVTLVLDGALVGIQQSGRQLSRNVVFSLVKLLALPLAALAVGLSAQTIFLVWLFGNLVSLLALARRKEALRAWLTTTPSLRGFAPIWRTAAGHHWVNVSTQAPRLLLPIMVAAQLSDEANAGFFVTLLLIGVVWIIPIHLGTAMFALHSGNQQHFSTGLDTALRYSAVVSIAAAIAGPFLAGPLLAIFGPGYQDARYCFTILAICTFAGATKAIYISVRRAQGALGRAALAATAGAVLELTAAEIGLQLGGVTGVGIGVGAAIVLEAAFFAPAILKARRQSGQRGAADLDVPLVHGRPSNA
ncbi:MULTISPECIES: teichoic acid transporter [unclassified Mycobacterium]|uniref:lipopolysaccharide biosynthesis protein n=1 Tax=unclassified Mycobacterium TaxID=2642494 RepID=UPI0029C9A2DA|nr:MULTISPECIES: teichoic acid transporter [unclassified Mycobacterium]